MGIRSKLHRVETVGWNLCLGMPLWGLIGVLVTDQILHPPAFPQLKWCAWVAVYCSFISFANSRSSEDTKQMMSSFM